MEETMTLNVETKGAEKLQDLVDVVKEIQDRIVIRNNNVVNVYLTTEVKRASVPVEGFHELIGWEEKR